VRFRCVEAFIEIAHVVSHVSLPGDCLSVDFEFLKLRSFFTYAVEIKKLFGASISIPKPSCYRELVISHDLVLQGVRQVALRCEKYVSNCLVLGVALELDLRQLDPLLERPDAGSFSTFFCLCEACAMLDNPVDGCF
jgi:hypothetical protein